MLGSNPSADSVAKTEVGCPYPRPSPFIIPTLGIGAKAINPGVAGGVSEVMLMYLLNERNQLG